MMRQVLLLLVQHVDSVITRIQSSHDTHLGLALLKARMPAALAALTGLVAFDLPWPKAVGLRPALMMRRVLLVLVGTA